MSGKFPIRSCIMAMESFDSECTPLKTKYDECFNKWFRERYLKGETDHDEACGELFEAYQKCVKVDEFMQSLVVPTVRIAFLFTGCHEEAERTFARAFLRTIC